MCSTRKRSYEAASFEADDSDDDFDHSLQKRLRTGRSSRSKSKPRASIRNKKQISSTANSSDSFMNSINENCISTLVECVAPESNDDCLITDMNVSADQIISEVLDDCIDDCDDTYARAVTSHSPYRNTSQHITRPTEVPSPKKQATLVEYFRVEKNGTVLTKEMCKNCGNNSNLKMYRPTGGGGGQMVFKKPVKANNEISSLNTTAKRDCPFYKKIPGTTITVDAFQYGNIPDCNAYFLSHFHSDHYNGLTKHFRNAIYCSMGTGNLVCKKLGVLSQYVHKLSLNQPTVIGDVRVTLFDANHCPGSVLFLFVLTNGKVYLHTGDFRACQEMQQIPALKKIHVDQLYLDTTYCSPAYNFPSQGEVISYVVQKAKEAVNMDSKTLIVCGTYTIGKEKIFLAIAKLLKSKVFVSKEKKATLECLESTDISSPLSTEDPSSKVHVLPMMKITLKGLNEYLKKYSHKFNSVLGFKPTGWTYSGSTCSLSDIRPQTSGRVTIYGVPYSEHSSFSELKRFVQFIRPGKVIPTVFGGAGQRISDMKATFKEWLGN